MAKYLNLTGLTTFWTKVKSWVAAAVTTNSPSASKTVTGWNEGKITYGNIQISESQVTNLTTHLNAKAPLANPALTGTPTAPTAATGTNTTQIATTAFVNAEIDLKMGESDAMIYKGPIEGGSSGSYGALTPAANKGWTYKVKTAGKLDGVEVFVGDLLVCGVDDTPAATANNYATVWENWDYYPGNTDGAVIGPSTATSGNVVLFDGATGKLIKDSGKTLGKSVPSDAVFTDTKVTSAGNHYTPSADTSAELSAAASGATAAWSIDVVKAVQLQRDAKGHVVGVSVTSGKLPANPNSDTKVTQNSNSEDKEFPLLAKYTNNTTNETNTAKYAAGVTVNPSTKKISASGFVGDLEGTATSAAGYTEDGAIATALAGKSGTEHTHATSLATDSGTPAVTLAHATTYKLTAGGTSVIFKTPGDNNTDTKVKATAKTDNVNYKILATASDSPTSGGATEAVYDTDISLNPSTNTITANISGNAATASAAKSGSALETAIAAKASKVASATEGNFAALDANGDLVDSGHKHGDYKTKQTAKTDPTASGTAVSFIDTISQDANGVMTATKKTVRTMGAASSSAGGSTGLVPAPGSGKQNSFLRGDATWVVPTDTKNTAGSTDTSSKIFIVGATSQAANPQTYSHDTAYVGTDGCLYSNSQKVLTETVASNTYEPKMTPITDEEINALT